MRKSSSGYTHVLALLIVFVGVVALVATLYATQTGTNLFNFAHGPAAPLKATDCINLPKSDDFTNLNTNFWDVRSGSSSGIVIDGGKAKFFVAGAQPGNKDWPQLYAKKALCGDFDVTMDFSKFSYVLGKQRVDAGFGVDDQNGNGVCIERIESYDPVGQKELKYFVSCEDINGQWADLSKFIKPTNVDSWKLRIKRVGNQISTYFASGSGWVNANKFSDQNLGGKMYVGIQLQSRDPDHPDTQVFLDNFQATGQGVSGRGGGGGDDGGNCLTTEDCYGYYWDCRTGRRQCRSANVTCVNRRCVPQ